MSFGGGGDGGASWAMVSELQKEARRADAERALVEAQNKVKEDEVEKKRIQRTMSGGLSAFTTAGYTGYSDKTLGGGSSVSVTP